VPVHRLALGIGHRLREVGARRNEPEQEELFAH
jgi:hypothetical protein